MRPIILMAALAGCLSLGGCGTDTVHAERYALKQALGELFQACETRAEKIDGVAATLAGGGEDAEKASERWRAARRTAQQTEQDTVRMIGQADIDAAGRSLNALRAAEDEVIRAAAASKSEKARRAADAALASAREADQAIDLAATKFALQVGTFNAVMATFPANLAAWVMGEGKREPIALERPAGRARGEATATAQAGMASRE